MKIIFKLFFFFFFFPLIAAADNSSLIRMDGGEAYFDNNTTTIPPGEIIKSDEKFKIFEKAKLTFSGDVAVDRVDIHTSSGAQICYVLGYLTKDKNGQNQSTEVRYNGVTNWDIKADVSGIQSIPVEPPVRSSFFSIQCFVENDHKNDTPNEICFYFQGKKIELPLSVPVNIQTAASSTLSPPLVYSADNLFDNSDENVWAEGMPGNGEGTTLTFSFKNPTPISTLWFKNGHQRDDDMFEKNGKLKSFSFAGETYTLEENFGVQVVPLRREVCESTVTLTILSHYPGSKYTDLCLTEMGFKLGDIPYKPYPERFTKIAQMNTEKMSSAGWFIQALWKNGDTLDSVTFDYNTDTAHFKYFDMDLGVLYQGVARVISASPKKIILKLEGYLDRCDFDEYGNILYRKSRSAEKITMSIVKPSRLSYDECAAIISNNGLSNETLECYKNYKNEEEKPDSDYSWFGGVMWYDSPLGFRATHPMD